MLLCANNSSSKLTVQSYTVFKLRYEKQFQIPTFVLLSFDFWKKLDLFVAEEKNQIKNKIKTSEDEQAKDISFEFLLIKIVNNNKPVDL